MDRAMESVTEAGAGTPALLYDGISALRHAVTVCRQADTLVLAGETIAADTVPAAALVVRDSLPESLLLGRSDRPDWRLLLPLDAPPALLEGVARRGRFGRWVDRIGFVPAVVVGAAVSGAIVLGVMNLPRWLAPRIPTAWEQGIGDDAVGDLAANTCHTPQADAALAALVAQLDDGGAGTGKTGGGAIRVELVKVADINAVALPGGRILVFDGLVRNIGSPDALAGVIGHEIGHVRQRHVMQAMLRQFGMSMVLSGFRSGLGNTLGQMTTLRYSRDAESEADVWSRQRLAAAGISPVPTARFFAAAAEAETYRAPAVLGYLASHPESGLRAEAFANAWRAGTPYRPALTPAQFVAIARACTDDPRVRPFGS